jgi:hypothetical protein
MGVADVADLIELASAHQVRGSQALVAGDSTAAVVWLALAAEAAVDVLADAMGADSRKNHHRRATLARRAFDQGLVDEDLGSLLIRLNTERQRAVHDGTPPDLRGRRLEDVAEAVAALIRAAARSAERGAAQ